MDEFWSSDRARDNSPAINLPSDRCPVWIGNDKFPIAEYLLVMNLGRCEWMNDDTVRRLVLRKVHEDAPLYMEVWIAQSLLRCVEFFGGLKPQIGFRR